MEYFDGICKIELRDLLVKNWMTHDAMWFAHAMQLCGIEKANEINKAAVKATAMIEIKRMRKAFGVGEIKNFEDLRKFLLEAFEVVRGPFMHFDFSFPQENLMHWEVPDCFAYEGVSKLGIVDEYQCGIFVRFEGWLEGLGVKYAASPEVDGCLMRKSGKCMREYQIAL